MIPQSSALTSTKAAPPEFSWWSSHPARLKRRTMWSLVASGLLFVLFVALLAVFGLREALRQAGFSVPSDFGLMVVFCVVAFALGASMTLGLAGRLALRFGQCKQTQALDNDNFDWRILIAAVVVGFLGVLAGAQLRVLPVAVRMSLQMCAVLPLVALFVATMAPRKIRSRAGLRMIRAAAVLTGLTIGAMIFVTLLESTMQQLGKASGYATWAQSKPFLQWFNIPIVLTPVLLVVLVMCVIVFSMVRLGATAENEKPGEVDEADGEESETKEPTAPWYEELRDALAAELALEGVGVGDLKEILSDPADYSPEAPGGLHEQWFPGIHATVDQAKAFDSFVDNYEKLYTNTDREAPIALAGTRARDLSSPDLLLTGQPGAGRTTTAMACALYAVLNRGQRVLFITSSSERATYSARRLQRLLGQMRVSTHFTANHIAESADVLGWATGSQPCPDILVGTVSNVEEKLFGFDSNNAAAIRHLILSLQVIVVDDLLEIPEPDRSHVPFMLDRQRVLLGAEFIPLQAVITCPPIDGEVAANVVAERLFGGLFLSEIHTLKPRCVGRRLEINLEVQSEKRDSMHKVVQRVVEQCVQRSRSVVVLEPGADLKEREKLSGELNEKGKPQQVWVIADPDEPLKPITVPDPLALDDDDETAAPEALDAAVFRMVNDPTVAAAIRLNLGGDDTCIFVVRLGKVANDMNSAEDVAAVPLFVSYTSPGMRAAYLYSIARLLPVGAPVPSRVLSQFGLNMINRNTKSGNPVGPTFDLDLPSADHDISASVWGMISLRTAPQGPAAGFNALKEANNPWRIRLLAGKKSGSPMADIAKESDAMPPPQAKWYSNEQEMGTTNLVHLSELRLTIDAKQTHLVAESFEKTPGGLRIIARRASANSHTEYLPVLDVRWDIPAEVRPQDMQKGGDAGLGWFACKLENAPLTAKVVTRIIGQMNEYGSVSDRHGVGYEYPSRPWPIVLGPQALEFETAHEVARQCLAGHWETGEGNDTDITYSPALTGAFNYALNHYLRGADYYGRYLAFALSGDRARLGKAVIWCIEPDSTGDTVWSVLGKMLHDDSMRLRMIVKATGMLEDLAASGAAERTIKLRRRARISFEGDEAAVDCEASLALLRNIKERYTSATKLEGF